MRKFVSLILLVCSLSFGGLADELTSADGIASLSFYTNLDDVNLSLLGGKKLLMDCICTVSRLIFM